MITDDEHIRIIPVPGTCELTESVLQQQIVSHSLSPFTLPSLVISVVVNDFKDLVPGVADIIVIPPEVAVLSN